MKSRLLHMTGEPAEIAHLNWHQRTAMLEEARKRNRASAWGKRHRRLSACLLLLQIGLFVSLWFSWGWLALWMPVIMILVLAWTVPQVVLMIVDAGYERGELESLMRERGVRPTICFNCRYDLRNTTNNTCPECGEAIGRPSARG